MKYPILVHNSLIIPPKNDKPSEVESFCAIRGIYVREGGYITLGEVQ
jgi:hypothetical protein